MDYKSQNLPPEFDLQSELRNPNSPIYNQVLTHFDLPTRLLLSLPKLTKDSPELNDVAKELDMTDSQLLDSYRFNPKRVDRERIKVTIRKSYPRFAPFSIRLMPTT